MPSYQRKNIHTTKPWKIEKGVKMFFLHTSVFFFSSVALLRTHKKTFKGKKMNISAVLHLTAVSILLIIFLWSCKTLEFSRSLNKAILVSIEFGTSINDPFGIPIKKPNIDFITLNLGKDSVHFANSYFTLDIPPVAKESFKFLYTDNNNRIEGQFLIPKYNEVKYRSVINMESLVPDTIFPFYYKRPIRTGTWLFEIDGNKKTENYNIKIGSKYL